ncbi:FAD-dependent oxidoreductase [Desertivibrio insolitus]|uniref:FAD-dependent oxidoreductase n=1 Tax=Herbiconiux sp. SYSU D00978 TaxID=2812562 RepID=UPI001F601153|nr:FAD-dependent oxidoreductase [Herbiconiux sp. SYSU D00978]
MSMSIAAQPNLTMQSLWEATKPHIESDDFEADARYDEVIVGAGITGLVTALLFARAGRRVAVLEARHVGAVTTGNTTAKISVLQAARLQDVLDHNTKAVAQAYVEGQLEGLEWIVRYCRDHDVPVQRKDSITYATTFEGAKVVDRGFHVAQKLGLPVERLEDAGLPFPTTAAIRLRDQAQFHPLEFLAALVADIRRHGGVVIEGVRVTKVKASAKPVMVGSNRGEVYADHVIVATGMPILDRGLYWAKETPKRSYAVSFRAPGQRPDGMYISVDQPTRSIRSYGDDQLIIGGNGHVVGRHEDSTTGRVEDLVTWTKENFPGAEPTNAWSAQDYEPPHKVPFVGWMPRGRGRVFLATGYNKWGMTNAVAAALTLAGDILGGHVTWAKVLRRRITLPKTIAEGIGANLAVASWYARGWWRALARLQPVEAPEEGQGVLGREGLRPVAKSTVDGMTCALSAICPHQHAIVQWNDAERSWDCPAHGSRFAADGSLLEGPSIKPMKRLDVG